MPVYCYQVKGDVAGCTHCHDGFETTQSIKADALKVCPECGAEIVKVPVVAGFGYSVSNFDDRAKAAGFSKLQKLGSGEYEKKY